MNWRKWGEIILWIIVTTLLFDGSLHLLGIGCANDLLLEFAGLHKEHVHTATCTHEEPWWSHFSLAGAILGLVLYWGFRLHIFCCVIPALFVWWRKCKCHHHCEEHCHDHHKEQC